MMPRVLHIALALVVIVAGHHPALAETFMIEAGQALLDARQPLQGPTTIIVTDGRIMKVMDGVGHALPAGAARIDLTSATVIPGLIDAHVHLTGDHSNPWWSAALRTPEYDVAIGLKNARATAQAGFTTVRDAGAQPAVVFAVRDAIAAGLHPGPRIVAAGSTITIPGGHGEAGGGFRPDVRALLTSGSTCSGADACAHQVREAAKAGADFIKIAATGGALSRNSRGLDRYFTDAELAAIVNTAHGLGMKVAAHASGPQGNAAAVKAGVDSIEHGTFAEPATVQAMVSKKTYFVPTLLAFQGIEERLGTGAYTPEVETKVRTVLTAWGRTLSMAHKAGVPIAFGTDAGVFAHGRNAEEAALMIRFGGLTPREVLIAATINAAALLGLDHETGTISPGKSADLVAVEGDPTKDVQSLRRIRFVMARGTVVLPPKVP